jgi:hypothetical protein
MPFLEEWIRARTRDVTDERIAFAYAALEYGAVAVALLLVNFVFSYAKIITVVRNRKIVIFTPFEAIGFVIAHPLRTIGLYVSVGLLWIGLVLSYWLYGYLAPDATTSTLEMILVAWGVGQIFILGRIFVKCLFLGSQTALYEKVKEKALAGAQEPAALIGISENGVELDRESEETGDVRQQAT